MAEDPARPVCARHGCHHGYDAHDAETGLCTVEGCTCHRYARAHEGPFATPDWNTAALVDAIRRNVHRSRAEVRPVADDPDRVEVTVHREFGDGPDLSTIAAELTTAADPFAAAERETRALVDLIFAKLREQHAALQQRPTQTFRGSCQYCDWQGDVHETRDPATTDCRAHLATCPGHPIRAVEREREELRNELTVSRRERNAMHETLADIQRYIRRARGGDRD